MKTLVIDTAFEQCQVGIWDGPVCVASASAQGGGQHDRILASLVEKMMAEAHTDLANLDRIFVTTGPGRFTGLRVGIAFARGLALVHDTPLIGVSTVDALVQDWTLYTQEHKIETDKQALLVAVKRGETYVFRVSEKDAKLECIMDDDFLRHFGQQDKIVFAGMISAEIHDIIAENANMSVVDDIQYPSLSAIFLAGNVQDISENKPVRPHYALA